MDYGKRGTGGQSEIGKSHSECCAGAVEVVGTKNVKQLAPQDMFANEQQKSLSGEDQAISVEVQVLGRKYPILCSPKSKAALLAAVSYLDRRLEEMRAPDDQPLQARDRIVMTIAINLANELLAASAQPKQPRNSWQTKLDVFASDLEKAVDQRQK